MQRDEISQLMIAFKQMQTNLRQLIGELAEKSSEASDMANQLSSITEQRSGDLPPGRSGGVVLRPEKLYQTCAGAA